MINKTDLPWWTRITDQPRHAPWDEVHISLYDAVQQVELNPQAIEHFYVDDEPLTRSQVAELMRVKNQWRRGYCYRQD